jgi:hypothetical protein
MDLDQSNRRAPRPSGCTPGIALAMIAASALAGCSAQDSSASAASVTASTICGPSVAHDRSEALAYHDLWRKLWEDHITWTRVVIISILDDLPGTQAYIGRLLQNYEDMEDALRPYYGDDAEVLGDLIQDHLVIAANILVALKTGDPGLSALIASWYDNADAIAAQMAEMNPQYWPFAETDAMWREHLDATIEEATAHFSGDFAAEIAAYDRIVDLALEMADFFSNGVEQQFPSQFNGNGVGHGHAH